jgi:hypothetical protein
MHRRGFAIPAALAALGLLVVGARAVLVADGSGQMSPLELVLLFVFGAWVPLGVLVYAIRRRRVGAIVLAFCVGLSVNVAFLANAVPAKAASGNTSLFYLYGPNSSACGNSPMGQTNADTGPASYPGGAGINYFWCSDTFASSQSLSAGTIQAEVSLTNSSGTKDCLYYGELFWWHAATSTSTSIGQSSLQTLPNSTNTITTFTWSWSTSAVTFADGDMLRFLYRFHSSASNCTSSTAWSTTLAQPAKITVAMIVSESVAGLLLLAPGVPLGARWWKRKRR